LANSSITVIGDCSEDLIFSVEGPGADLGYDSKEHCKEMCFNYGGKIVAESLEKHFGGNAYNTSIAFSKLGLDTKLCSIIGDDDDAKAMAVALKEENIDCSHVIREGMTNISSVILYKKERTIISYHAKRDYRQIKLPQTGWYYFTSASGGSEKILPKILAERKIVVFNPGSWQMENFRLFNPYLSEIDILIVNKSEAKEISGKDKVRDMIKKILDEGVKFVVITDGVNGCYVADKNASFHSGIFPSDTLDPTGAGDSFSGGFIGAIAQGKSIVTAIKWGMINSASVVEKFGATEGLLNQDHIDRLEESWKSFKLKSLTD